MSTPYLEFLRAELAPGLMEGLWTSVLVIVPSALLGVFIGLTAGVLRVYGPKPVRKFTEAYVSLFRGTPLVVQVFFWYFALPYITIGGRPGPKRCVISSRSLGPFRFTLEIGRASCRERV